MNRTTLDFLIPMLPFTHFSDFNILVINQTSEDKILKSDYPGVRVINSYDKGLTKSRNLALDNAIGELCVITDDDVIFNQDFEGVIVKTFNENKTAALISFRVQTPQGELFRKYPSHRKSNLTTIDMLHIMSVEMVLNKKLVGDTRFNENFGLGSKFVMGEEAIFVNELRKKNKVIVIEPSVIVIHPQFTTDHKVTVKEKYYIQGAFFTTLFGERYFLWILLKLFFDLKQHKIKFHELKKAAKAAFNGRKDIQTIHENIN